jgi:hypothetical protein
MFIERIDGVGPGRIGRRRQHIALAHCGDDVRRMAAARALGVESMYRAVFECSQRVL